MPHPRPPVVAPDVSPGELAWAAGLFEGEGTVTLTSRGASGYSILLAIIGHTDREVIDFFHTRWGGSVYERKPQSDRHRQAWDWRVRSRVAGVFLEAIRPHVRTTRVREKIDVALACQALRRMGAHGSAYRAQIEVHVAHLRVLNAKGPRTIVQPAR